MISLNMPAPPGAEWERLSWIANLRRIRMVLSRASGAVMASSLKQNTFLDFKVASGGEACDVVS